MLKQVIQLNCQFVLMRPQSAKPDFKRNMRQSSAEQVNQQHFQKQQQRKQVRLIKPDLTSHDYSRILPQKIQQDKQRLYSQALKLKQMLNQTSQENIKLKTKISVLEKEKDKINKYIQTAPQGLGGKMSRINLYANRSLEKDNMITRNLKKLIREGRQQNDSLRMENNKIKKMMKYTKINELQILLQTIVQENKKLNDIVRDYAEYAFNHEQIEQQNENLKKYIEEEISQRQKFAQQREKYEEIIDQLQEELKGQKQRHNNKQSKIVNQLRAEKRKGNDLQRRNQQLSRVIKSLRQNVEYLQQRNKNASKNVVKVTKSLKNSNNNQKIATQKSQQNIGLQKNYIQVMQKNKYLQKQLDDSTNKLKQANNRIKQLQEQITKTSKLKIESSNSSEREAEKPQGDEYINKEYLEINEDSYKEQFEQEQKIQNINKQRQKSQLQNLKKQFQQSEEQQQIFKKDDSKTNKQKKKKSNSKKSPQKQTKKTTKKQLSQIKQLLTYRMKAQRYPFSDIKQDILKSQTDTFSFTELSHMLISQPFYLTQQYAQIFLSFCYQKQQINPIDSISNKFLVEKLRKVIDDFELMQEQDEKQMIIRISQMTSSYPQQLQAAFENMQNGYGTISKKDLIQMFEKLQLEKEYIELIIAQLSLYSSDLQHLNYGGFFERFYIDDQEDDNYAIEEQGQQSQQSKRHSSRVNKSAQKIQKHQQSEQMDD